MSGRSSAPLPGHIATTPRRRWCPASNLDSGRPGCPDGARTVDPSAIRSCSEKILLSGPEYELLHTTSPVSLFTRLIETFRSLPDRCRLPSIRWVAPRSWRASWDRRGRAFHAGAAFDNTLMPGVLPGWQSARRASRRRAARRPACCCWRTAAPRRSVLDWPGGDVSLPPEPQQHRPARDHQQHDRPGTPADGAVGEQRMSRRRPDWMKVSCDTRRSSSRRSMADP